MTSNSYSTIVEEAFRKHEIVPDSIPRPPKEILNIVYGSGHRIELGTIAAPIQVKDQPVVSWNAENGGLYTLAMIDPDAPSRKDPNRIEFEHWLVINIPGKDIEKGETISSYFGAGPPKNTEIIESRKRHITEFVDKHNLGAPVAGNFFQAEYDDYVAELHKKLGVQ